MWLTTFRYLRKSYYGINYIFMLIRLVLQYLILFWKSFINGALRLHFWISIGVSKLLCKWSSRGFNNQIVVNISPHFWVSESSTIPFVFVESIWVGLSIIVPIDIVWSLFIFELSRFQSILKSVNILMQMIWI